MRSLDHTLPSCPCLVLQEWNRIGLWGHFLMWRLRGRCDGRVGSWVLGYRFWWREWRRRRISWDWSLRISWFLCSCRSYKKITLNLIQGRLLIRCLRFRSCWRLYLPALLGKDFFLFVRYGLIGKQLHILTLMGSYYWKEVVVWRRNVPFCRWALCFGVKKWQKYDWKVAVGLLWWYLPAAGVTIYTRRECFRGGCFMFFYELYEDALWRMLVCYLGVFYWACYLVYVIRGEVLSADGAIPMFSGGVE